jgi:hypothetical protein
LPSLTNKILQVAKTLWKGWMLVFQKVRTFSASVLITHCLSHSQYLWKNKN